MGSAASVLNGRRRQRKQSLRSRPGFQSNEESVVGNDKSWLGNEKGNIAVQSRPIMDNLGAPPQTRDNFRTRPIVTSSGPRSANMQRQTRPAMKTSDSWQRLGSKSQTWDTQAPIATVTEVHSQTFPRAQQSQNSQEIPATGKNVQKFWYRIAGQLYEDTPPRRTVDYYYNQLDPNATWIKNKRLCGPLEKAYNEWILQIPSELKPKVYNPENRAEFGKVPRDNRWKDSAIARRVHDNEVAFWNYDQKPKKGESSLGWNILQEFRELKAKYSLRELALIVEPNRAKMGMWKPLPEPGVRVF